MILSRWCIVNIIALITGAIVAMKNKDGDCFRASIILIILIGFGYLIALGY